jgi:hypothetical protein
MLDILGIMSYYFPVNLNKHTKKYKGKTKKPEI